MNKKISILISGWYGSRNVGDEAILLSIIKTVRSIHPACDINVLSPYPNEVKKMYGVNAIKHTNLYSVKSVIGAFFKGHIFALLKIAKKSDILIIGGGGLIKDSNGVKKLLHTIDEVYLFKLLGKKCAFISIGVGPLDSRSGKYVLNKVSKKIDAFIVRDKSSAVLAESVIDANSVNISVAADPTFMLVEKEILKPSDLWIDYLSESVVICPRALPEYDSENNGSDVSVVLSELICYLVEYLGKRVILLPFCRNKNDDDMVVIEKVINNLAKDMVDDHVVAVDQEYGPDEVKWILGNAWCVIGMRLHAVIFSASMAVPFIGIHGNCSARPKIHDFASEIDMEDLTYDLTEYKLEEVIAKISFLKENYELISRDLQKKSVEMKSRSFHAVKTILELI